MTEPEQVEWSDDSLHCGGDPADEPIALPPLPFPDGYDVDLESSDPVQRYYKGGA